MALFGGVESNYHPAPHAEPDPSMAPARHVSRWAVAAVAAVAASLLTTIVRQGTCGSAARAASCAGGAARDHGAVKLWRLEDLGVHHYAFPALMAPKFPVVFHVWLKAQRQAGKVSLRCCAGSAWAL